MTGLVVLLGSTSAWSRAAIRKGECKQRKRDDNLRRLRANTMRGNRTESLREEHLPRRGSRRDLQKPPKGSLLGLNLHDQCTSRRFLEVLSETLSETLGPVAPHRVDPYFSKKESQREREGGWEWTCKISRNRKIGASAGSGIKVNGTCKRNRNTKRTYWWRNEGDWENLRKKEGTIKKGRNNKKRSSETTIQKRQAKTKMNESQKLDSTIWLDEQGIFWKEMKGMKKHFPPQRKVRDEHNVNEEVMNEGNKRYAQHYTKEGQTRRRLAKAKTETRRKLKNVISLKWRHLLPKAMWKIIE